MRNSCKRLAGPLAAPLLVAVTLAAPQRAGAELSLLPGFNVEARARGALSILGVTTIPNEAASTLSLNSQNKEGYEFQSGQFGGAFTVSRDFPLYLEGYAGYARYDPVFVFSDGSDDNLLPLKWNMVSATGGVGWDFPLTSTLTLRPIVNFSLGYIESDASLLKRFIESELDVKLDFLKGGNLTAAGVGGALMLDYEYAAPEFEIDSELRYSHMHLEPVLGSSAVSASSDAITVGWWNRLRVPTGVDALDAPLRAVFEASGGYYPGDQGEALQTEWMVQVGSGLELDFSNSRVPASRGRIMARYAFGERLTGFSIGLAVSF
jgi:hypothetical protein